MGAPKGNQNRATHKIWSLVSAMRGSRILDGRTVQAQQIKKTMASLAVAKGCSNWSELSPALQILSRRISFKDLICSAVEDECLRNGKKIPEGLCEAYLAWSNSLRQDLQTFGLERTPKDISIPTIAEIQQRYEGSE